MHKEATIFARPGLLQWAAAVAFIALLSPPPAFATLNELFETYNAPQALAMGNAFTADATGYNSLFYNPAALAKAQARGWEVNILSIDGIFNTGFLAPALAAKSIGMNQIIPKLATDHGYEYFRVNGVASVTRRGFGLALLYADEFAGTSDGTTLDARAGTDISIVTGVASNFFSNMLKMGVSIKGIIRNQLKGSYAISSLTGADATSALMKEGLGIGADAGIALTLPMSYLPTLAFAIKDILGTQFRASHILNPLNSGIPGAIAQSMNLAASLHPFLFRGVRATLSAEFRHIERSDLPLQKRLGFGLQIVTRKQLFFWLGMNQLLLPTGGIGLRLPGGAFEMGSYAQDTGAGTTISADRRFMFRWTIGF